MIFSTESAFNVGTNDVAFLDAGIIEGANFVNARKEKSSGGNSFLELEFNKDGQKSTHTEWEVTQANGQSEEEFMQKANNQMARILQVLAVFYSKDQLKFTASSMDGFLSWAQAMLNAVDKTKGVRIKLVYNDKGYTGLPRYAKYTFIEPMTIDKADSKIKELAIDVFVRPNIGDKEAAAKSAAATFATPF